MESECQNGNYIVKIEILNIETDKKDRSGLKQGRSERKYAIIKHARTDSTTAVNGLRVDRYLRIGADMSYYKR